MKKMRILALAMAMAMTAGAFSGCADQGSGSGTGDGGKTETPVIKWYSLGGTVPGDFKDAVDAMNARLDELKVGAHIDVTVFEWDPFEQSVQKMINGGDYFDIVFTNGSSYTRYVQQGAFMDITEKVKTVAPEMEEFIPDNIWDGTKIDGKIYAVPTYKDSSMTQFWYFDHEKVEKYDIDVKSVHTMDDLTPIFEKVKAGEGEKFYPVKMTKGNPWNGFFNMFDTLGSGVQSVGVRIDDESRKVVNVLEDEEVLHNLDVLRSWYEAGYINPDANVSNENYKGNFFGTGQGWPSAAIGWADGQGIEKYDITDPIDGPLYTSETVLGSLNAISVNSDHPDEALKVLQACNMDTKLRDMLAFGKEGVHFEYVEKKLDDGSGETRQAVKLLKDDWTTGWAKYTQASFFNCTLKVDEPDTQWDEIKEQNAAAKESVCMGFLMDISPVQNEVSACKQIFDTYKPDLLTGARDPKELVPVMNEELKAAGMDTIIAEAQKQVNAFFA